MWAYDTQLDERMSKVEQAHTKGLADVDTALRGQLSTLEEISTQIRTKFNGFDSRITDIKIDGAGGGGQGKAEGGRWKRGFCDRKDAKDPGVVGNDATTFNAWT